MKNTITLFLSILLGISHSNAQTDISSDTDKIKLFVDQQNTIDENKDISVDLSTRIYYKTVQLINHNSVAEIGYSNFFVTPKFFVVDIRSTDAGMERLYIAKCDLTYTVSRRSYGNSSSVSYNSYTRHLTGSGKTEDAAIFDAVNNISSIDKGIVEFLKQTKEKIKSYFDQHCDDVKKEAEQAVKLGAYDQAIALYFSVPPKAPCYQTAYDNSLATYRKYQEQICTKKLTIIRAMVARALSNDGSSNNMYNQVIDTIKDLDPSYDACFKDVQKEINKIENRFDEKQKREWELKLKILNDANEVDKERYRAMTRVCNGYQPIPSSPVIINNR